MYSIHGSVIAKQGSERMSFIRWIKQTRFITGSNGFKKRGLRFWSEPPPAICLCACGFQAEAWGYHVATHVMLECLYRVKRNQARCSRHRAGQLESPFCLLFSKVLVHLSRASCKAWEKSFPPPVSNGELLILNDQQLCVCLPRAVNTVKLAQ